jgi:hypothetical protein
MCHQVKKGLCIYISLLSDAWSSLVVTQPWCFYLPALIDLDWVAVSLSLTISKESTKEAYKTIKSKFYRFIVG